MGWYLKERERERERERVLSIVQPKSKTAGYFIYKKDNLKRCCCRHFLHCSMVKSVCTFLIICCRSPLSFTIQVRTYIRYTTLYHTIILVRHQYITQANHYVSYEILNTYRSTCQTTFSKVFCKFHTYEPRREKTSFLHIGKQRRRSARS